MREARIRGNRGQSKAGLIGTLGVGSVPEMAELSTIEAGLSASSQEQSRFTGGDKQHQEKMETTK